MKQELKTREQLEKSIKDKLPYYRGADLSAHTIEQLWRILSKSKRGASAIAKGILKKKS